MKRVLIGLVAGFGAALCLAAGSALTLESLDQRVVTLETKVAALEAKAALPPLMDGALNEVGATETTLFEPMKIGDTGNVLRLRPIKAHPEGVLCEIFIAKRMHAVRKIGGQAQEVDIIGSGGGTMIVRGLDMSNRQFGNQYLPTEQFRVVKPPSAAGIPGTLEIVKPQP